MNTMAKQFSALLSNRLVVFAVASILLVGSGLGINALIHTSNTSSYSVSPSSARTTPSRANVSPNTPSTNDASSSVAATIQPIPNVSTPETAPTNTSSGAVPSTSTSLPSPQPTCSEESQITATQAQIQQDLNNITDLRNEISNLTQNPYEPLTAWQGQLDNYDSALQTTQQRYADDSALLVSLDKDCQ
jgi:hypothetical protein